MRFVIIVMFVFMVSCISQFSQTIMLKDSKGNSYGLTTIYNNNEHKVAISIAYKDKNYSCEAIYDPNFKTDAMIYEIDLDILEKTGMAVIFYKGQRYSCKVESI
jgi:hypothetical protein